VGRDFSAMVFDARREAVLLVTDKCPRRTPSPSLPLWRDGGERGDPWSSSAHPSLRRDPDCVRESRRENLRRRRGSVPERVVRVLVRQGLADAIGVSMSAPPPGIDFTRHRPIPPLSLPTGARTGAYRSSGCAWPVRSRRCDHDSLSRPDRNDSRPTRPPRTSCSFATSLRHADRARIERGKARGIRVCAGVGG